MIYTKRQVSSLFNLKVAPFKKNEVIDLKDIFLRDPKMGKLYKSNLIKHFGFNELDPQLINFKVIENRLYILSLIPNFNFSIPETFAFKDKNSATIKEFKMIKKLVDIKSNFLRNERRLNSSFFINSPVNFIGIEMSDPVKEYNSIKEYLETRLVGDLNTKSSFPELESSIYLEFLNQKNIPFIKKDLLLQYINDLIPYIQRDWLESNHLIKKPEAFIAVDYKISSVLNDLLNQAINKIDKKVA